MDEIETFDSPEVELDESVTIEEVSTAQVMLATAVVLLAGYGAFEVGKKAVKRAKFEYKAYKIVRKMTETTDTDVSEES